MERKQEINTDTKILAKKLIKLRDITKNDRTECNQEILEFLNYKTQRENYQFDAFLVKAINQRFRGSMDADITLIAFGLMRGYEYDKIATTNRRCKYLKESDYLSYNSRNKIKSFIGIDSAEKKKLIENLRKKENKRIEWLADFLLDQGNIRQFIEEVDNYIEIVDGKQFAKLPEPSYLTNRHIQGKGCGGEPNLPPQIDDEILKSEEPCGMNNDVGENDNDSPVSPIITDDNFETDENADDILIKPDRNTGNEEETDAADTHKNEEPKKPDKAAMQSLLDELCEPEDGELFEDMLPRVWEALSLAGKPDLAVLEALLIKIIVDMYGDGRDDAMRQDISLLTFGLLDGYYHTRTGVGSKEKGRYWEYLIGSDYMKLDYPSKKKFVKLSSEEQNAILTKLKNIGTYCKSEVCNRLIKLIEDDECSIFINVVVSEYTSTPLDGSKLQFNLPVPRFTLANYPRHELGAIQNKKKLCYCSLLAALTVTVVFLAVTVYKLASERTFGLPDIQSIEVRNKNIHLEPGEDEWLSIRTEPRGVDARSLEYTSSNRTVVKTEKNHIIAHMVNKDISYEVVITVQGGDFAEDKAFVTVSERIPQGAGKNIDD